MADQPSGEPTLEQRRLHADLVTRYGQRIFEQGSHLSGLALCLGALATDQLSPMEREITYRNASSHLALLLDTVMKPAESAMVSECAKRLDAAVSQWVLDDIEARDGLPTSEKP